MKQEGPIDEGSSGAPSGHAVLWPAGRTDDPCERRRDDGGVALERLGVTSWTDGQGARRARSIEIDNLSCVRLDGLAQTAFLVDLPGDEVLVLPAADARILSRGEGDEDLRQRAISAAAAWRKERYRLERRIRVPDWLMVFVEEVQSATTATQIHRALVVYAPQVVGAYTALIFAGEQAGEAVHLQPLQSPLDPIQLPSLPATPALRFEATAVVTEVEVRDDGASPYPMLAPVLSAFGAAQLVCTAVGPDALLVLVERRRDRVFTGEDRDMLRWVVRQAERALAGLPQDGLGVSDA